MAIIDKKMCDVLRLILLLNQMDTPGIALLAHNANTLLEHQEMENIVDQNQDELIEV